MNKDFPKTILLHELTREEARAYAQDTLIILPTGAIEQHGPHLAVGTDFLTIDYIARASATEAAKEIPVLVAPSLPYGSSHHHLPFGGTISLRTETYYRVVYDLAESLIVGGFRRIFILNGHGGNNELIQLAARDLALKHPAHLAAASYWALAWDELIREEAHLAGRLPGHAGAFETSQMLAIHPELVRDSRPHRADAAGSDPRELYQPCRIESYGFWESIDGYTDSPSRADARRGAVYLEAVVRSIARNLVEFYRRAG
jgi:creatinine amidohydrolase